jgi:hypothetical protein
MRTTVSINDELLATAKSAARQRHCSLGRLLEDALRRELARTSAEPPPVPVFRGGTGPRPGVDLRSNRALAELLDPADKLPQTGPGR